MKNKILITGITGQDGVFLTKRLLSKSPHIQILGLTRSNNNDSYYQKLNYLDNKLDYQNIKLVNTDQNNFDKLNLLIKDYRPDAVFNLTGPSSVYNSVKNPVDTSKEMITGFLNITNSLIENKNFCNFFQPSSSEMFNQHISSGLDENSNLNPSSSYALSKFYIHKFIDILRIKYDWCISNGILFNHESEFRDDNYLIMKIINRAIEIKKDPNLNLIIGSLDHARDWSYAEDIVEAINKLVDLDLGSNYVLGSGKASSIKDIVEFIFQELNLNWEEHVQVDNKLLRKGEPKSIVSVPSKILKEANWKTTTELNEILSKCIFYKQKIINL
tara:strand:+ start:45508 stop:46494 length:987 start_codon:yes stop_codon:yes gene_type:complete